MSKDPRVVFVVHGRNDELRSAMFDFLRALGLKPLEWDQAVALTGHGSPYVGQVLEAAFSRAQAIVVLLTPDEITYLRPEYISGPNEGVPEPQSRPNVLFEAGMAFGHDAAHTVIVEVGKMRPFSDVAGRHLVRLGNDVRSRKGLALRLETAGCAVDISGYDWLTAGNFTPPREPTGEQSSAQVPPASGTRIDPDIKAWVEGADSKPAMARLLKVANDSLLDPHIRGVAADAISTSPKGEFHEYQGSIRSLAESLMGVSHEELGTSGVRMGRALVDAEVAGLDVFERAFRNNRWKIRSAAVTHATKFDVPYVLSLYELIGSRLSYWRPVQSITEQLVRLAPTFDAGQSARAIGILEALLSNPAQSPTQQEKLVAAIELLRS